MEQPSGGLRDEEEPNAQDRRADVQGGDGDAVGILAEERRGIVVHDGAPDGTDVDPPGEESNQDTAQVGRRDLGRVDVGESDEEAVG